MEGGSKDVSREGNEEEVNTVSDSQSEIRSEMYTQVVLYYIICTNYKGVYNNRVKGGRGHSNINHSGMNNYSILHT